MGSKTYPHAMAKGLGVKACPGQDVAARGAVGSCAAVGLGLVINPMVISMAAPRK